MLLLLTVVYRGMVSVMQQPQAAEAPTPDQTSDLDGLLMVTAKVASEVLGISTYHVGLLIEAGELSSTKIGKTLFIPASSIRDYVARITTPTAAGQ